MAPMVNSETGFFVFHLGGSGAIAAPPLRELWNADGRQFPMYQVLIDTDKANDHYKEGGIVDASIPVRLDYDEIQTVKATPGSFGPVVARIVAQVAVMLDPEEMGNGARTLRPCAQLPWEVRRHDIADKLNQCIRNFLRQSGCKKIIPVAATSTGGGTGSAFSILLADSLQEKSFRGRVLQGFSDGLLRTLELFAVEPFYRAFANANDPNHTSRILGNSMAFRIESEFLERHGCFATIYHLGLSSPGGGAVLDSEREVSRVLGTTIYQYLKYWGACIKPLKVNRPLFSRYGGQDTPEFLLERLQPAPEPSGNGQPAAPSNPNAPRW